MLHRTSSLKVDNAGYPFIWVPIETPIDLMASCPDGRVWCQPDLAEAQGWDGQAISPTLHGQAT
eukprot:scaffold126975_cov40-Tisochrysis_lutea.AAC.1